MVDAMICEALLIAAMVALNVAMIGVIALTYRIFRGWWERP